MSPENRLARETSPYLLQHAHNPVDWYPWREEALERARREDKPILLSIGYAACHWCHVMERESFENESIAALMNEHFLCIKVDREERPDLDEIYMAATVAMSGSGGWPMTVFLTPEQQPFFAGTYFPPSDRHGRPGFRTLLERLAEMWKNERATLLDQAAELTRHVRLQAHLSRPSSVSDTAIDRAVQQLAQSFDERWGGFGSAPKFPPSASLGLLLRRHRRHPSEELLRMVTATLDGMKSGGVYDQLGGGFARYSTDERWLVPHFEKMLYDNAQLSRIYLEAFQVTQNPEYRRIAAETLDYVAREMQAPEGGYFSATDADSEGVEGKFFVWTPDQVADVLDADAADHFNTYYDVTPEGNWEGVSVLNTPRPLAEVARELGLDVEQLAQSLAESRRRLYAARAERVPPLLDDKILTSWNGLMIGAMAEGYRVLGDRRYLESAERAARHALAALRRPDGGLYRTARAGRAHLPAYLEDYAFLCDALIDVYEAGGAAGHLTSATELARRMLDDFGDAESQAFFLTAHDHEPLLTRSREGTDSAIPGANAVAARVLLRLSGLLGRDDLRERAAAAVRAHGRSIETAPRAFATTLAVVDSLLEPAVELAVIGSPDDPACRELWAELGRHYLPNRVIAHHDPAGGEPAPELPLLEGRNQPSPAVYVCRNYACQLPARTPGDLARALTDASAGAERAVEVGGARLGGAATRDATARYAAAFAARHAYGYTVLGSTQLAVSRIGFGGYRIDDSSGAHRAALRAALTSGTNLIDTSTNYGDGASERLVGEVLAELAGSGQLPRDQVVVVSKIGYAQGKNLEHARLQKARGHAYPEMVEYADQIWHCIHPAWIERQLSDSLLRLGLETLDVCLLHNPEYFLSDAKQRGRGPLAELRREFYARLEQAFAHLEEEITRGRIRAYGVSSNTAVVAADDPEATELLQMLAAAERAGGREHGFRVLQLPFNLLEPGAALELNNMNRSVLATAAVHGLAVLVNRPLNAITNGSLLRLADPPETESTLTFAEQRERVAALEQEFRADIAAQLRVRPGAPPATGFFAWAEQLADMPARIESFDQWRELEYHLIRPRVGEIVAALDRALSGAALQRWHAWQRRYLPALDGLLQLLSSQAAARSRARIATLRRSVDPLLPEERRNAPTSQTALWLLLSTPGVSAVLVGMREEAYVADALTPLGWAAHPEPARVLAALVE